MKDQFNDEKENLLDQTAESNKNERFEITDEHKKTVAALKERLGKNIAVEQDERSPGQHW